MDFWKFVQMLENKALFMCRADLLGDNWEGILPNHKKEKMSKWQVDLQKLEEYARKSFVSCWHKNKIENYAMWKVYVETKPGIAIKTRISSLYKSLPVGHVLSAGDSPGYPKCFEQEDVRINKVVYCDFDKPVGKIFSRFYKRKAFKYEDEIRLFANPREADIKGFYAPCDLSTLIEELVVSPGTSDEFVLFLKKTLKMYGLENVPVRKSGLDEDPPQTVR